MIKIINDNKIYAVLTEQKIPRSMNKMDLEQNWSRQLKKKTYLFLGSGQINVIDYNIYIFKGTKT